MFDKGDKGDTKKTSTRRKITRVAVTGAIIAVPMAALAGPALADTLPGVVQVDQNWQNGHDNDHHDNNWQNNNNWQHDRDDHRNDNRPNNPWNLPIPPQWFNGGQIAPQIAPQAPGGLFGSS